MARLQVSWLLASATAAPRWLGCRLPQNYRLQKGPKLESGAVSWLTTECRATSGAVPSCDGNSLTQGKLTEGKKTAALQSKTCHTERRRTFRKASDFIDFVLIRAILGCRSGGGIGLRYRFADFCLFGVLLLGTTRATSDHTTRHAASLPDIATTLEAGFADSDYTRIGLFAPAGTPPLVVQKINNAIRSAENIPAVRAKFEGLTVEPMALPRSEFDTFVRKKILLNVSPIKALGLLAH